MSGKVNNIKRKGEKNIFVTVLKIIIVVLLFLIQIVGMFLLYTTARVIYMYARVVYNIAKIITVLYIIYHHDSASYKISWIIFIMFVPIVGILAYILWGRSKMRMKKELELRKVRVYSENLLQDSKNILDEIKKCDKYKYNQVEYMTKISGYPLYNNHGVEYYDIGEKFFDALKKDLLKAKKYILMEFFIFDRGKLWDEIFDILKNKAKEGVKVKIIMDSLGCLLKNTKNMKEELENAGIQVYKFNPFSPVISGYINYRDHRKIVVIDGCYGYTGGVNIADEYVNLVSKFGHWKDVGIKIEGEAVWSLTIMFLRTLESVTNENIDYNWYKKKFKDLKKQNGYVLPLADGPDNRKSPIENTYIQTINYAKDYVYMTTPYFIISEQLLTAMLNSARGGVDVRVIVPHIPDKKLVYLATRSYYEVLLEAGIKVYEYKPGFIHSKTFVADDNTSIVGTANLDFRSMHLNFEDIIWTYKTGEEKNIKYDFERMLTNCIQINLDEWKSRSRITKMAEAVVAAFAPML